jgi:hypothetical protein
MPVREEAYVFTAGNGQQFSPETGGQMTASSARACIMGDSSGRRLDCRSAMSYVNV